MSAWYITRKDLLLLAKDKRAVVLLLILPLLFIAMVGMSTGQFLTRSENTQRFKVATIDASPSDVSRRFVEALTRHSALIVTTFVSVEEARESLKRGEATILVVIDASFDQRIESFQISEAFRLGSGAATNDSSLGITFENRPAMAGIARLLEDIVRTQARQFALRFAAERDPVAKAWKPQTPPETNDIKASTSSAEVRATNATRTAGAYLWIVPGFTVMFAFFLISVMARSFIAERDNGTLKRLLLAPIGIPSILVGKTAPFYVTSVAQCLLLFGCGRLLFGMSWGPSPAYLIPVILCTSLAVTSLGLLLATVVHTDQQVSSYGTTLILLLSSVSGCFFPREMFPPLMKRISLFTPHGWALRAFDGVLTQSTVDAQLVLTCCGMLLLFSSVFFALGWWRFRTSQ